MGKEDGKSRRASTICILCSSPIIAQCGLPYTGNNWQHVFDPAHAPATPSIETVVMLSVGPRLAFDGALALVGSRGISPLGESRSYQIG